jgi:histone deacetylase 1/2
MATFADIWHRRLGHPSSRIMSLLASNKNVVCTSRHLNFQCQACPLGKSSRLSLGPTGHKTSTPLELIFSDVWGPAPMLSSDGFHYFIIFMDAHTKFIWFYPIAVKSDVFNVFQQFQVLVERQFSRKIKTVQTDWDDEYHKLNSFFKTISIHHRLICPHTHEQKGIVERRHRHIVETSLTLLGQCKAPLKFWNYAFKTSVYLINRLPTSILSNKSPFECLFHQTPDYAFLRTFGCLCFPFLHPYNAHKLDYRSTLCVFLGYSSSHLSYRCLDLSSDHIYISRHVRFHEQVFPFIKSIIPSISSSPPVTVSSLPPLTIFPSQPVSAPPPLPTNLFVPLPSSPSMSLDHYVGSGSAVPALSSSDSPSTADSPASSSALSSPSGHSAQSMPCLDLCVDLSTYSLPQLTSTDLPFSPPPIRQHPMVLRPRQPKTANISFVSASSPPVSTSWVMSPSALEPLSFKEADQ